MASQRSNRIRNFVLILSGIAICLSILSIITEYVVEVVYANEATTLTTVLDLFSVNLESSIPTWFSTITLFIAFLILALIARDRWQQSMPFRWHWIGLMLVFLYLSMDEGAAIHEIASDPVSASLNTTGYLTFGWQVVVLPILMIFLLLYLRFLMDLPLKTRFGFMISGLLYIGGAVIVEGLSANQYALENSDYSFFYLGIATIEETMEMFGVLAFIYTLLSYCMQMSVSLSFDPPAKTEAIEAPKTDNWDAVLERLLVKFRRSYAVGGLLTVGLGTNLTWLSWMVIRESVHTDMSPSLMIACLIGGIVSGFILYQLFCGQLTTINALMVGAIGVALHLGSIFWLLFWNMQVTPILILALPVILALITSGYLMPTLYKKQQWQSYVWLVLGMILGAISIQVLDGLSRTLIIWLNVSTVLLITGYLAPSALGWLRMGVISAGLMWFSPAIAEGLYAQQLIQTYDLPANTTIILSDYSLFQKIDVLQDTNEDRYLYLDGIEYFNPNRNTAYHAIMGRIPAAITQPDTAFVWGANALQLDLIIANYTGQVVTIEPDATVIEVSQLHFDAYNYQDRLTNSEFVISSLSAYLKSTQEIANFITMDLPDPVVFENYSATLFKQIAEHLTVDGVFAVNLGGEFTPANEQARQIVATLLPIFQDVMVVTSPAEDRSFAYASHDQLPFTANEILQVIEATDEFAIGIFEVDAVRAITGDVQPLQFTP